MPDLNDFKREGDRWLLSCDGGGIRGIITLHCLRAFERFFQAPCQEMFDLFAGTSTGAIIAGSLASGCLEVEDLIRLYRERREEIFSRSAWSYLFGRLATKYRKEPIHRLLHEVLKEKTLAECPKDILITATDTVRSETIFFTSFRRERGEPFGAYKDLKLRHVIASSLSAPTYFPPHGRFIDGGVGIHNNPCYVAAVEALRYSYDWDRKQTSNYTPGKVVVFSFGTGAEANHMKPDEAMRKMNLGWIDYVIGEGMDQANVQQSNVMEYELDWIEQHAVFFRYQIMLGDSFNEEEWREIFGGPVPEDIDFGELALDATDDVRFGFLDLLGQRFGDHLQDKEFFLPDRLPPKRRAKLPAKDKPDPAGFVYEACFPKRSRRETREDLRKYAEEIKREFDELDERFGL